MPKVRVQQRGESEQCPLCLDQLTEDAQEFTCACGVRYHRACVEEMGGECVPGCERKLGAETARHDDRSRIVLWWQARTGQRTTGPRLLLQAVGALLGGLLGGLLGALVGPNDFWGPFHVGFVGGWLIGAGVGWLIGRWLTPPPPGPRA